MGARPAQHDNVKDLARDSDPAVRMRLASDPATPAEILYFLAEDATPEIRRAVVENPATPRQADTLATRDSDYTVRCLLARKIVGNGLPDDERSQLWRMGFTILETLARDKLVRVRRTLAEAIKSDKSAPRPIILELARDLERDVAVPVLRHSPVLNRQDLVDIAAGDAPDWARAAIAEREALDADVSEAIVARGDVPTITRLLDNKRAVIDDRTIERVVDRAPKVTEWHEPLVKRPTLPVSAVMKLARFVAAPLFALLRARKGLDPKVAGEIDKVAKSRGIEQPQPAANKPAANKPAAKEPPREPQQENNSGEANTGAEHLFRQGRLTDEAVGLALDAGDDDFVVSALALRTGIPRETVRLILESRSPRTVTALCWKAGQTMRFALEVQKRISRIPPGKLLNARDGRGFPLSADEMEFQLDLVVEF